jgi:hypothetical protein
MNYDDPSRLLPLSDNLTSLLLGSRVIKPSSKSGLVSVPEVNVDEVIFFGAPIAKALTRFLQHPGCALVSIRLSILLKSKFILLSSGQIKLVLRIKGKAVFEITPYELKVFKLSNT